MAYQVQVPLSGIAGWRYLERTQEAQKATFENDALMQREIAYFKENIGKVETAEDLIGDYRLLEFALTAYGLEDDTYKKALVRTVLEGGTDDEDSLANRITVNGYKEMAEDFGFGNETGVQTATEGFADKIISAFKERKFETAVSEEKDYLGTVMAFERSIDMLTGAEAAAEGDEEAKAKSWYTVLGDEDLRTFFEGAFGLPSQFVNLDIDQQARMMERKAEQFLGDGSLSALEDEANVDKLITRFLAFQQIEEGWNNPQGPGANALKILQGNDSSASYGIINLLYGIDE